ncbi:DUF1328 domain-containing protein [Paludisphaera borealis]|uniref:Uncharacterized protein n=1 Tax=Paludisphaera borealis TaxID=1387353 RepID=A0A1U7CV95_9BACT|nr:DUF1328 domain-containing protein [Paludisphaera borealis]APW62874.1 hypothetical protein BSF38_04430 [Paludisphaera borealis]
MLKLALFLAIISILAGAFGFYGVSDAFATFAKMFALICAILFVVTFVIGLIAVRDTTA